MKTSTILSGLSLLASALAQQAGTQEPEVHPKMTWQRCTGTGGTSCTTVNGEVVIDSNWRWAHDVGGYENCFSGNEWTSKCSSNDDCAKNCAIEGANYAQTYGATTSGNALSLKFVTTHQHGTNIGSRLYLMETATKYQMFTLMNNELAFDVNLANIPCGMNSALYLVPMAPDGGMSTQTNNNAGAKYGTGYCDAQCARDLKWIGGQGNYQGWGASSTDENSGVGELGACCAEIDIWESNRESFAFTPHACDPGFNGYHVCKTTSCGGTYSEERHGGHCDANGCDYNPYRLGNHEFYGPGKTIDTNSKFTVISRFTPTEATQTYIQNGVVHEMPTPKIAGLTQFPAKITADFCKAYPPIFEDFDRHEDIGGHASLVEALRLPMVLVMSVWGDHSISMLWLDSVYPPEKIGVPGTLRGRCPADGRRAPADLVRDHPNATVTWSNIKFGPIGSTYNLSNPGTGTPPTTQPGTPPTTPPAPQPTVAPPANCAARWGQCGGQGWNGPTCCQSGSTCRAQNQWYSQCL